MAKLWKKLVLVLSLPIILADYFSSETGREYGISFFTRLKLARTMAKNRKRITTASHFLEHLVMATRILKVPRAVEGCVVECGSFKGGSAANLSLVCALCKRELQIFDSFEGLPEPGDIDKEHLLVGAQEIHTYAKGAWSGTLPEVQSNISKYGQISACKFNVGYFEQTLPGFPQRCILAFLDVDLTSSLQTCLKHLWPRLQDGCCIFTHEAPHREIAGLFFDREWWRINLNCDAPGLIGAGNGLGLHPASGGFSSDLGYTVKNPAVGQFEISPQTGQFSR